MPEHEGESEKAGEEELVPHACRPGHKRGSDRIRREEAGEELAEQQGQEQEGGAAGQHENAGVHPALAHLFQGLDGAEADDGDPGQVEGGLDLAAVFRGEAGERPRKAGEGRDQEEQGGIGTVPGARDEVVAGQGGDRDQEGAGHGQDRRQLEQGGGGAPFPIAGVECAEVQGDAEGDEAGEGDSRFLRELGEATHPSGQEEPVNHRNEEGEHQVEDQLFRIDTEFADFFAHAESSRQSMPGRRAFFKRDLRAVSLDRGGAAGFQWMRVQTEKKGGCTCTP